MFCLNNWNIISIALTLLILSILSPLIPDIVNIFRDKKSRLYSTDELYEAYDWAILKIFKCSVCQSFWASVIASAIINPDKFVISVFTVYPFVFVLWLGIKYLYAKTNIY